MAASCLDSIRKVCVASAEQRVSPLEMAAVLLGRTWVLEYYVMLLESTIHHPWDISIIRDAIHAVV